ncbi:hypothetical protein ACHAPE_003352 [Trichoderma viride]
MKTPDGLRTPTVAVSSDSPLQNVYRDQHFGSQRSLASKRNILILISDKIDRLATLQLRVCERPHVVIHMKSVARKQSRAQGGAAIVGSPRFPPPARCHSARLPSPGATAFGTVRSKEIHRCIDDRGRAPQQKRGVDGSDQ